MIICIKNITQAAWPKNSTINNHTAEMEAVHYILCGAAITATAVIVVCCIALPLCNQFIICMVLPLHC